MINARLVDPRDVPQEVEQPTYLVTFWSQPGLSRGIPSHMLGWSSSESDVQGGDLDEVLDRARDAPGRTGPADRVTVALLYDLPDGRGSAQIWLLGDDPRVDSRRRLA